MKNRVEHIDIAKGIGMFYVVAAHASVVYWGWVKSFHMPLFFLISGYLYNRDDSLKTYIIKKGKRLYVPFVLYSFFAYFFRFLFLDTPFSMKYIVTFTGLYNDGVLFGSIWFLGNLFLIDVIFKMLDILNNKKTIVAALLMMVGGFIGYYFTSIDYTINRFFLMMCFFASGVIFKIMSGKVNSYLVGGICLIVFLIIRNVEMPLYIDFVKIMLCGLTMSYVTILLAHFVDVHNLWFKVWISYIGRNSMDIVVWHFVMFRIVIAAQLLLSGISIKKIWDYYPVYYGEGFWWIAYTFVGIVCSLAFASMLRKIKDLLDVGENEKKR